MCNDPRMSFEATMRLFFGRAARQSASSAFFLSHRNTWLRKALSVMLKAVDRVDASSKRREWMMKQIDDVHGLLNRAKEPSWDIVFHLFRLCGLLLGFDFDSGRPNYAVIHTQTAGQVQRRRVNEGGWKTYFADCQTSAAIRSRLVSELKAHDLEDFKIAMVFNMSEHEVKKLLREQAANAIANPRTVH